MQRYSGIILSGCVALVLLVAAAPASANRALGIEPGGAITATSVGEITFVTSTSVQIICRLVLRGEITVREVSKAAARRLPEGLIGRITSGTAEACTQNPGAATVIFLAERNTPYEIRYDAFLGTLPNISGISTTELFFGFSMRWGILTCLFQGTNEMLVTNPPSEEGGGMRFTRVRFIGGGARMRSTEPGCPGSVETRGELRLTAAQRLTLR